MTQAQRDIKRKLAVLRYAEESGNVALTCRHFGISRQCFHVWKRAYEKDGTAGLINKKPCPKNVALRTPAPIEEKILHLRRTYHFGPPRIAWYLERYHGIEISASGVHRVLTRNGLSRLPAHCRVRSIASKRYEKQMPGHHVQVDVKFLKFVGPAGRHLKRYQFTAVDDATCIRALKVYERHTQENAIDFIDHVVERFPFRIHTVRTACYESFVNPSHGLSGSWASNRVKDPGWSVCGLPIVPHPDSFVPEGARVARRSRRVGASACLQPSHDNGRPLPLFGSKPKPSGNSYATRATPFPECSASKISRRFMTANA